MFTGISKSESFWMSAGLVAATVCFTAWGYIWYASVFDDVWQGLIARTEDELIALAQARGFMQSVLSYLISGIQAAGLFLILRMTRAASFLAYHAVAAILSVLIALPVLGNAVLFAGTPTWLWVLDFLHFIFGYAGMATIFFISQHFAQKSGAKQSIEQNEAASAQISRI
jgi:hypothetical protein